jgi:hypothetical protein
MQSKILKLIVIISVFIIVSVFPVKVFSSWADDADNFLKSAGSGITVDKDQLTSASDEIYNTLTSIGMIVAVIVGMILGITYMMTGAVDKAKVKESIMPYLLGCIVIFGAFGIWKLVINVMNGVG